VASATSTASAQATTMATASFTGRETT
jgi:hypothetical protein